MCTTGEVRSSFALGAETADCWVHYYVHCLIEQERRESSESRTVSKRLFLDINVMKNIHKEANALPGETVIYRSGKLSYALHQFLPPSDYLRGVTEILFPMLRSGHFSVYVVNFVKKRVDILDPNDWEVIGPGWKNTHMRKCHYADSNQTFFKVMVRRLNNAIHKVRPDMGISRFGNYKCEMVQNIPKQRPGSNDCAFYAMWYMEYYNADHGHIRGHTV